jgi:hypothetical protein
MNSFARFKRVSSLLFPVMEGIGGTVFADVFSEVFAAVDSSEL